MTDLELGVGCLHIGSLIVVRSSRDQCDELLLSLSLFLHISITEEGTHDWISEHVLVKLVNNSANSSLSSQPRIETLFLFYSKHIIFNRVEHFLELIRLSCWNLVERKRFLKIVPSLVELFFADFELGMGCLHISSFIVVRTANDHRDELFLPASLLHHVSVLEEIVDHWISEHIIVKFIDYGADSTFSSQSFEKRSFVLLDRAKSADESLEDSDVGAKKNFLREFLGLFITDHARGAWLEWTLLFDCFYISFHRVKHSLKFRNLSCWNVEEMKGLFKIYPSFIELLLANLELCVGGFHVGSFILIWSTCNKSNELLLSLSLFLHVGVGKERTNDWVGKHVLIKLVNHGTDCSLSSKAIVKTCLYVDNIALN